ncbi:hypothetical protein L1887_36971 [Cichorium endivia]|nr:hypothetical protein L1887_36971 [Cichorium endivia]
MSEYHLPFPIQEEIMKRLPVKSLIRFRSISLEWKSLIESSEFIGAHSLHRHTQPQHLLVSYKAPIIGRNYVSYIDDHTFPKQRSVPTLPVSIKQLINARVVGSSHGLVCLYGYDPNHTTWTTLFWNPSVRKSIAVPVSNKRYVGFGVCPVTADPKILSITQSWDDPNIKTSYHCKVMVYTLSSGKWRSLSTNLPSKLLNNWFSVVVTDGFIYWRVRLPEHMIMSFDVTNESFQVIDLPYSLTFSDSGFVDISKRRDSLALLQYGIDLSTVSVWMMMEDGAQRSFTKLYTIRTRHIFIVGFRKNDIPIMKVSDDYQLSKLVVYDPNSEHNNVLEICGSYDLFNVNTYMETLLLLGRSDCSSY